EIQILTSGAVIRDAVDTTNAPPEKIMAKLGGGNSLVEAVRYLQDHLDVDVPRHSDVIKVSLRHPDKQIVAKALDSIVDKYLIKHHTIHGEPIAEATLNEKASDYEKRLAEVERDLRAKKGQIITVEDERKTLTDQIQKIRQAIAASESELAANQA